MKTDVLRDELKKWRTFFDLDGTWTFEVNADTDTEKMTVMVNYNTFHVVYRISETCPLDDEDLDIFAFRQAVSMVIAVTLLQNMGDDDSDEPDDAQFHKAVTKTSDALCKAMGFMVVPRVKEAKAAVSKYIAMNDEEYGHA